MSQRASGFTVIRAKRLAPLALAALAFVWVLRSPINAAGSDPHGSLVVSLALIETGSLRLDDYVGPADLPSRNLVEHHGRVDYFFPIGVPLAGVPAVWLADRLGWDLLGLEGEARLHKWLAALSVALSVLLVYRFSQLLLTRGPSGLHVLVAILLTSVLVFGSSFTSTMGTAFWSNGLAAVINLAALLILVGWSSPKAGAEPRTQISPAPSHQLNLLPWSRAITLGLLLSAGPVARPSSALLGVLVLIYVAYAGGWRSALRLGTVIGLAAAVFCGWSLVTYDHLVPPYYQPARLSGESTFWTAFAGHIVSPGRGILVFSPWMVPILLGVIVFWRRLLRDPLFLLSAAWVLLYWLAVSRFPHWWDGHSFGSRMFVEVLPAVVVIALLVWREWRELRIAPALWRGVTGVVLVLGIFAIWVHAWQALYALPTVMWDGGDWGPVLGDINIDEHPEYLWDWRYPQMLASEAMIAHRYREHQLRELPRLVMGETIGAGSDPRFFEDWFDVEQAGDVTWRWSDGGSSVIRFTLTPEDLDVDAVYRLQLRAGTFEGLSAKLELNGETVGKLAPGRHFEPMDLSIEVDGSRLREVNALVFRVDDPRPAGGGDDRQLGVGFHRLRIER